MYCMLWKVTGLNKHHEKTIRYHVALDSIKVNNTYHVSSTRFLPRINEPVLTSGRTASNNAVS